MDAYVSHELPAADKDRHCVTDQHFCWCCPTVDMFLHSDLSINYIVKHVSWARRVSAPMYRKKLNRTFEP